MGKCLKLCVLALACTMAFGCAAKHSQREDNSMRAEQRFRRSYEAAFNNNEQQDNQQLLRKARSAIGTPYVSGGMSPGGFDCSGFVCWAYKSVGVSLPRTAREQSVVGKRITNVEDMRVGDIVAFRHPRRGYHTGIYVGDGKFIHSPHRRTTVRINSLDDPYFKGTFLGARRVKMDGTENAVAEAETRLNDYAEEKAVRDIYRSHKSSRNSVASKDDHKKSSKNRGKEKNRSKDKTPSKSRDKYVEVASLDKKHSSARKSEVEKAEKSSGKSSSKSSAKENKSDKKSGSSASKSRSSAAEREKSEHKSESRKSDSPKAERKTESHKPEAAKSDKKSSSSKGESAKKSKNDADKEASSKSENSKSKKHPEKKRDNKS